jgi:hypothetical protein
VDNAGVARLATAEAQAFDLNIEQVLEHWPVAYAVREFIANALDEQILSSTDEPAITKSGQGEWHIRDYGRGVRYEHLTQKENLEKLRHPGVIGQFGIGLKDALAVCDRRGATVRLRSRHGDITTAALAKAGFPDVITLHGLIATPSEPTMVGTDVELTGVSDEDMAVAKGFFLRFSDPVTLEETRYGDVLARSPGEPGRIYVRGLRVAEEPNFLFSYNITDINALLRRAMNRERTNVGRGAYSDRVKEIVRSCRSGDVARPLAEDLSRFTAGTMHDELGWKDVAIHACRVLQTVDKVVFISAVHLQAAGSVVQHARDDGYRVVLVSEAIAHALVGLTDLEGRPMVDLGRFAQQWNESFSYSFVDPEQLTVTERAVFDLTEPTAKLAGIDLTKRKIAVMVSETMRIGEGASEVVGVWEKHERRVVIKRNQLGDPVSWCGTLLHELTHARTGTPDLSLPFEEALTVTGGVVSTAALGVSQRGDGGAQPAQ